MSNSLCSHGLQPVRLLCPWDSPGKNTGVSCEAFLQGIFPTHGSNLYLLCLFLSQVKFGNSCFLSFLLIHLDRNSEKALATHSSILAWRIPWMEEAGRLQSMGSLRVRHDFSFTFHFHALEKEMATHSSVLAWRIPGMGEPGGLPSMGSHRVRHD